jgi:hypothetical protein
MLEMGLFFTILYVIATFVWYQVHLCLTEAWPAAFIDIVQILAGVCVAIVICNVGPWSGWMNRKSKDQSDEGIKVVIRIIVAIVSTIFISTIVLSAIFAVAFVISAIVPPEHAVAMTYSGVTAGVIAFVSHTSMESILHEQVSGVIRKWRP